MSNPQSLSTPVNESEPALESIETRLEELTDLSETLCQEARALHSDDWAPPQREYALPPDFQLTVVMPAFNEEATLEQIVARVLKLPFPMELILVDDCSTDATPQIMEKLRCDPRIRTLAHAKNQGKGAALRTGFKHAQGDVVIVQDADLEYDPGDMVKLLHPLVENRADVVYGSRFLENKEQDPSWLHRFGNGLLSTTSNLLTGLRLTDMETCYKAFRREVLADVVIRQNRFGFEPEITAKVARRNYRLQELPISYHARGYEEGKKIGLRDAVNAFYCIVRYALAD